jgi:hypothetical protein
MDVVGVIANQEVRTTTGLIQARCSNLLRGVGSKAAPSIHSVTHKVHGRETPRGLSVVGLTVYDLFDHHRPPVIKQTVQVMIACQRLNDRYASVRAAIAAVSLAIKPPDAADKFFCIRDDV